jgi:hypothetical protein
MISQENPFLYKLLKSKILHQSAIEGNPDPCEESDNDEGDYNNEDDRDSLAMSESDDEDTSVNEEKKAKAKAAAKLHRAHVVGPFTSSFLLFC